jgi:MFS family permease
MKRHNHNAGWDRNIAVLAEAAPACDHAQAKGRARTASRGHMPMIRDRASVAVLVATLASTYVVSQLLRSSIGVLAPNLAAEMAMPAAQIGLLSSAFFFSFAATQLPLGVAIDRYGPKRCMLACALVVIVSAVLFAWARTPAELIAARVLMGIGTSSYLVAPLAFYARSSPPERFAQLAGLHMGLGTIGTLLATAPLAFAAAAIGWRASFVAIAGCMGAAALLTLLIMREPPPASSQPHQSLRDSVSGIAHAIRTPGVGRLFLMMMATYSTFALFVGLWGGPYLTHVYGYDLTARGSLLLIPATTQVLGLTLFGSSDRLVGSYRIPVAVGALSTAGLLAILVIGGRLQAVPLLVWLAFYGLCAGFTPVVIAHGRSLFPPHLIGRGITLLNMGSMGGTFLTQAVSGVVIDVFPSSHGVYPPEAYRRVFALQAGFLVTALIVYLAAPDPYRRGAGPSGVAPEEMNKDSQTRENRAH